MGQVAPHPSARSGITAPERLKAVHDLSQFDCGEPLINEWLKQHAGACEGRTARTYVVCQAHVVVGYYCIANGSVERKSAPGKLRRNAPDPIPVGIVGRLGVTAAWKGQGLGQDLLQDALKRVLSASEIIGIRAVVVHAINDDVARFYKAEGFLPSPTDPRTMFMPVETIVGAL